LESFSNLSSRVPLRPLRNGDAYRIGPQCPVCSLRLGDSGSDAGHRPESIIPHPGSKTRLKAPPLRSKSLKVDYGASFL
jgi:hypothetical protein